MATAYTVLRRQGIFIPKELETEFLPILKSYGDALLEEEFGMDPHMPRERTSREPIWNDGQAVLDALKEKIRDHILVRNL